MTTSSTAPEGSVERRRVPSDDVASATPGGHVLEIRLDEGDGYTICRPVGELDAYTVGQFREALGELASKPKLLIDMSEVPFVDSAGLGALIGGIRRAREGGGDVAVCCNRPTLVRLLHTTGFDRIVTVAETLEEAAASLADDQPANT
jgi:anti-sigma B factor antagonist